MTENNTQNNPLNLDIESLQYKVYFEFFVNHNENRKDMANKFHTSVGSVNAVISKLKRKLVFNSTSVQSQEEVVLPNLDTPELKKSIVLKMYEEENKIILYIKTCKEFEEYLIKNKEVRESTNLWNQGKSGKFYHLRIVENYNDDVNRPIIYNGIINFAVLRIPGISKGIEFQVDGLLTNKQVGDASRKLLLAFKNFYKSKIICQKINVEASLEIEDEE